MTETCVTLPVYHDAQDLKRRRIKAERAEDAYDACFADRLTTIYKGFVDDWGVETEATFFEKYREAAAEYKKYDLSGQLKRAFNLCKAAVQAVHDDNPAKAEAMLLSEASNCR